jgi:tetratricopeptide (TPR) repeat protein
VKLMQRRALNAVALALGIVGVPTLASAQSGRGNQPGPDTPRLLVVVCQSPVRALGVEVADAMRTRFINQMNPRQLFIIPREHMVTFLESSGYKADSSLGPTDMRELARGLRADDLLGCDVVKNGTAMRVSPRLMLASDPSVAQPLPVIETSSLNDVGRQAERSYHEARKQLVDDRACKNHLRSALDGSGKVIKPDELDKAVVSANTGIAKYSNATIVRLCLANTYQLKQMWDSVLSVIDVIKKIDPGSKQANIFAVEATKRKADAETDPVKQQVYREASVRLLVAVLNSDPYNQAVQNSVISELAKLGKPAVAIPIVDDLLKLSPGDPPLLRTRWQLMGADAASSDSATKAAKFERYLVAGEEMVKADTALADSVYYSRQVSAAMTVSAVKGVEWTSKAVVKYPTNQDYWWYKASMERKAGQTDAASRSLSRLVQLNSKYPNATVMLAQLYVDQRMFDSAVAMARRAVQAGEPRQTWGQLLIAPMNAQYVRADSANVRANADSSNRDKRAAATLEFEAALALAQEVEKMSPSPHAYFFMSVSAYQIGVAAVNRVQATQAAMQRGAGTKQAPRPAEMTALRASACADAKRAQDMFLLVMINMGRGGSVSPQAAGAILGAVPQYQPFVDQAATAFCRPLPAPATKTGTKGGTTPPPAGTKAP